MIFIVFDPSPLTLWINCCFFYILDGKDNSLFAFVSVRVL